MNECILPFIIGGFAVGTTVFLSKRLSPEAGAIFYWFPIMFVATIIATNDHKISNQFAKKAWPAGVLLLSFIAMYIFFIKRNPKSWIMNLFLTTLAWLVLAIIMYHLIYGFKQK